MVAFIEHQAQRAAIFTATECGLDHDQRVIGNNDGSAFRAANGMFHKAFAIMRASGMNAFPPPIRERQDIGRTE